MTSNEDFLFAQEAVAFGFVTDAQVKEALELQRRMADDLKLDERLAVLLVKRGYLAEDQARRVYAKIQPDKGGPGEIEGYRLLEVVGRGAMGTVYRAQHLGLNRTVAIKILRPDLAGDRTQIARLKAEATMLASLDHPNIVRALDAGESNGFPYVVMEYVEGESLRDKLRRDGPFPEADALRITRALADALERARRMGVVHRDVKPGNVLLTKAGAPKLMDLGLAKGPIDLGLTQHGATVGTPQYIAPEQALDPKKADTRSDIYALGASLYAMLTGEPPFDGKTLAEILTKVLYEVPVPVRTRRPEVSAEAGYLVERMMLRDPSLRYRTPALVVADIDRLTQGTSILPHGFSGNWEAFLLRKRVRRTSVLVGSAVLVLALGYGGWKWISDTRARIQGKELVGRQIDDLRAAKDRDPMDSVQALEARIENLSRAVEGMRRYDMPDSEGFESEIALRRAQRDELRALDERVEKRVRPAAAAGEFASGEAALQEFAKTAVSILARNQAEKSIRSLQHDSDEALDRDRRERAFPAAPRDVDEIAQAALRWAERVSTRYARTPEQGGEQIRANRANKAAERIAQSVRTNLDTVSDARLAESVERLRLFESIGDIENARSAADAMLHDEGPALTATERRYVVPSTLVRLVGKPFDERKEELDRRVAAAWAALAAKAADASKTDPDAALSMLDAFKAAASRGACYPAISQEAARLRDDLHAATTAAVSAAHKAITQVTVAVVNALRADNLDAVAAAVAGAPPPRFPFAERALNDLRRVAPRLIKFREEAFSALGQHLGTDESRWIPTLQLRGDPLPEPEQKLEILRIDSLDRTFDFRTHKGNGTQPPQHRRLLDVADEDLFRLANIDSKSPDGAWLRGVLAIAGLPVVHENFYVALRALNETLDRFHVAGAEGSPLFAWADAERERQEAAKAENEGVAQTHLEKGRNGMASEDWSNAEKHFSALIDRTVEPTLKLTFTQVATKNHDYLVARIQELRQQHNVDSIARLWRGARIERRQGASPDSLDIVAEFDFNGASLLKDSFVAGWARLELTPVGPGRVMTPGPGQDFSLRLLPFAPGAARETVADRPLVLESPLLARVARSMQFQYWPESPFVLVLDLDGVQVAIVSDDPESHLLPHDVPMLPDEKVPPKVDVFGTGRGVKFHAGPEIGDAARWGWGDEYQGRRFLKPYSESVKSKLGSQWFAFQSRQERPYAVKFSWEPERGASLEVDGSVVFIDLHLASPAFVPTPSGRIQILSYTSCVIDDLRITGRVDPEWLKRHSEPTTGTPRGASVAK
jgi:eukaryotic-like serine/threonine-protein kinase